MADQRFVLELETLIKLNSGDVLRQVRSLFNELRAEGQRAIASGSQAGVSHIPGLYTSALGITSAYTANAPGIAGSGRQGQLEAVMRRAEAEYGRLQVAASEQGLSLRNLTRLDEAQQRGSRLLQEALARQSNATLQATADAEKLAAAERRAAVETERAAQLAAQRGAVASRAPQGESVRYTLGGLGLTPAQLAAAQAGVAGPPDPSKERATIGGLGVSQAELAAINKRLAAVTSQQVLTEEESLQAEAKLIIEKRLRAAALARATRAEALDQGLGEGTFFQRLQATIHARGGFGGAGAGGDARLPSDYQSFGQFLTSKALTTGGFALSGAVLYGAISGFKQITQEASALQRELAIVKGQFETIGDTQGFQKFAKQVTEISVETGIAADQVALVARQLAGVFRDPTTGAADFNKALSETQAALKLTQVTGLPLQEITDSLTAITTSLGTSFTTIGDLAIGLEQRFGVLAPQIIAFTADVAPVAQALGFTVEQISALGAIAQQRSGVSGSALAESFNRALPAIQQAGVKIAEIFNQRPATAQFVTPVITALGTGQGATAIQELSKAYAVMTQNQRQALAELLGGPRAAKAFFAVLQGGKDTIDALNGSTDQYAGSLDQRFKDFQDTVSFAFEHARRSLEAFGLALFNSGLADGLKTIADAGADVATVAALLLKIFSEFNDLMGGLPVKLLAVYTMLRLISALGGGLGGLGNLISGIRGTPVAAPAPVSRLGFISATPVAEGAASELPYATTGAFGRTVAAKSTQSALAGFATSVAPAVAALAVAQLLQTVEKVRQQTADAIKGFDAKVSDLVKQGVNPDEIVKRIKEAGGGSVSSLDQLLNFGQETNQVTEGINQIQRDNADRQGKELDAIFKGADEAQRKAFAQLITKASPGDALLNPDDERIKKLTKSGGLEQFLKDFLSNPTNNANNDAVARIIEFARSGGASPGVIKELEAIAEQYKGSLDAAAAAQTATDYAPILEEVRARYESGNASLGELLAADRTQLANFKQILDNVNASQQNRLDAAKGFATQQKQTDTDITSAAQRAADITIKIAGLRGGDVAAATSAARLQQLQTIITHGGSPDTILDAALNALDAQQQQLEQFINSPVIQNGIARAPSAAEKLARAQQGVAIPPDVRNAIVKAQVATGANLEAVKLLAAQKGQTVDQTIDQVTQLIISGDASIADAMKAAIQVQIDELTRLIDSPAFSDRAAIQLGQKIAQLKSLINSLTPVQDPGAKTLGNGITDLQNQTAIEAGNEAKAYADAIIAQQRARANGDPIAEAQASIAAANNALRYASKPSERAAAVAQLIDAQNQLQDAQNAILDAQLGYAAAVLEHAGDPVAAARTRLQLAQQKVNEAKGEAAKLAAQSELLAAQQAVSDAITRVFDAQAQLISAIAAAAGDTVAVAKEALAVAQKHLADLVAAGRTDPTRDPDVAAAQAALVTAQAGVRDAELNRRTQDIDVALQLEKITTQQAIAQFEALLQIPNLTVDETNQILLKIKQLKDSLNQTLQFNIPGEIKLPTLYEVRRLSQAGTPAGPGAYQDNRQINVTLNANNQGDLKGALDTIVSVITAPPRNGSGG